ncbi:CCR4-NOT core DEDD family RNase subunit POP2 [Aspergillus melleus]|uniref:CCR4-NOT core DEDD family RNase subunit POP2 n=1 Tax=Aspergillus melleus TaxID=138277 RepID=UPI001E8EA9AE|nr:CCR4-NOT core DEDD RNase subunit [Aspergillus melleus]KAH8430553.1 CCR4-NOT core DEDD RNase subunit [Aspergillus melleus]
MPPPVGRYGPTGLSAPYTHLQQAHLQQQQQQQQQQPQHHPVHAQSANTALPPPSLGGHPGFAAGNPNTNINPFTLSGTGIASGMSVGGFGADGGGTGLASHAAQMGFARGAQMQQQQLHQAHDGRLALETKAGGVKTRIRDVWKHNLPQEMAILRQLVEKYPYISMDTEFPGIVARPIGSFTNKADYHYQTLRCNVDLLKMIQLGITLFSPEGEVPPPNATDANGQPMGNGLVPAPCTWQFNFRFSLEDDMYAQESTAMLAKAGIDFTMHDKNGIDPHDFGALLISSGLVLLDDVHWVSFHSGYDFGYLMKIMLCTSLPENEEQFHTLLNIFFPSLYDIKYLMKHAGRNQAVNDTPLTPAAAQILANLGQKSGLQDIADELGVKRVGIAHQAGSDSLVTGEIYWKMRQLVFNGTIDKSKYSGQIWGLNGQMPGPYQIHPHQTPNLNGATIYSSTGTPSTPNAAQSVGNQTPQHHGLGTLTPGAVGGVLGQFALGKS